MVCGDSCLNYILLLIWTTALKLSTLVHGFCINHFCYVQQPDYYLLRNAKLETAFHNSLKPSDFQSQGLHTILVGLPSDPATAYSPASYCRYHGIDPKAHLDFKTFILYSLYRRCLWKLKTWKVGKTVNDNKI